jgi:CheY-like chemotaxis protein
MLSQPLTPPSEPAPQAGAVTGYIGRERWVLVIDDDAAHLAVVRGLLEPLGFQVRTASDGESALALAAQFQPDLVLCDVALGTDNGWEIAARLRRRHGAALRIVMLSGEVHVVEGDAHDTLILKPFAFDALLDCLADQLGVEWVRAAGEPRAAAPEAPGAPSLPLVIAPVAAAHCAEIERLVRIGHVRAIEAEIDALAALAPEAVPLAERMRSALDSFDLKALAGLARMVQADAA